MPGLLMASQLMAQPLNKPSPQYTGTSDSLVAKRSLLTTTILKDNKLLSATEIRNLLAPTPKALKAYRWGKVLQPVGPVLILSGIAVGYLGIKGVQKSAFIRGVGTKTNPYPDDILVEYTHRSAPKLLAGLGLFVAGFYVIERSNELTATSVKLFNAKPSPIRTLSRVQSLKLGITSTGNLGLEAQF